MCTGIEGKEAENKLDNKGIRKETRSGNRRLVPLLVAEAGNKRDLCKFVGNSNLLETVDQ